MNGHWLDDGEYPNGYFSDGRFDIYVNELDNHYHICDLGVIVGTGYKFFSDATAAVDALYNFEKEDAFTKQYALATFTFTFMDGYREEFKNVRVRVSLTEPDPVVVDGTSVTIETEDDTVFHLLGVRYYVYDIQEES